MFTPIIQPIAEPLSRGMPMPPPAPERHCAAPWQPPAYPHCREFLRQRRPSTPVYLFCAAELKNTVAIFQRGFPGEVSFAVKANPQTDILRCLRRCGVRAFDVASLNEIRLLRSLFPEAHLHYNNPIKSAAMLEHAYHHENVRSFAVDDAAGLEQMSALAQRHAMTGAQARIEASVRFKLDHASAAYDFGSKFGASPAQCADLLKQAAHCGFKPSLAFHPGSQCTDEMIYREYIIAAAAIAKRAGVALHRLNVGGGFPVAYRNAEVNSLQAYFQVIGQTAAAVFADRMPILLCEPGRALVAASTSLVTQVIHRRENGVIFINDGIYGGLQEQFVSDIQLPLRVWRHRDIVNGAVSNRVDWNRPACTRAISTRVFGPTCDPTDRLPVKLDLPTDIAAGDWIEFGLLGAYGSATATQFNGFHSADYAPVATAFQAA